MCVVQLHLTLCLLTIRISAMKIYTYLDIDRFFTCAMWNFRKPVLESSGHSDQRTHTKKERSREMEKKRKKDEWVLKRDPGIRSRQAPLPIFFLPFRGKMSAGRTKSPRSIIDTEPGMGRKCARVVSRSRACESVKLVRSPSILLSTRIPDTSVRGFVKKSGRAPWISFAIRILMLRGHNQQSYFVHL